MIDIIYIMYVYLIDKTSYTIKKKDEQFASFNSKIMIPDIVGNFSSHLFPDHLRSWNDLESVPQLLFFYFSLLLENC
jgi:hypothetical protein